MSVFINLVGRVFGRLTVKKCAGQNKWGHAMWFCVCACGTKYKALGQCLKRGDCSSCGCLHREAEAHTIHGHCKHGKESPEYCAWASMIQRCTNPKATGWNRYGGANPPVRVCRRWRSFENFLADMGERPEGTSLGRTLDIGAYRPENVSWQTRIEQRAEATKKRALLKAECVSALAA
jgi:hypothetical protein